MATSTTRRTFVGASLAIAGVWGGSGSRLARAQGKYPARPIRVICPYAPGATTDALSRIVAQGLSAELGGSSVIVENRAGAGGNIGSAAAAAADPDGYTLLLGAMGPLSVNAAMYPKLGFDPEKDLSPLATIASIPLTLVVNPKFGVSDLKDLIEKARRSPELATYASAGSGTPMHLATELLAREAKVALRHVPYRGSAPAMNDVVAGHAPFMFDTVLNTLPQIKAGNVSALAVSSAERLPELKDVPTLKEAGYDVVVSGWYGILTQAKVAGEIRDTLSAALARVVAREDVRSKLAQLGSVPVDPDPSGLARLIREEAARWQPLVRAVGIKAE